MLAPNGTLTSGSAELETFATCNLAGERLEIELDRLAGKNSVAPPQRLSFVKAFLPQRGRS